MKLSEEILADTAEIECPQCGKTVTFKLRQVGETVICKDCGANIHLENNGLTKGLEEIDRKLGELFR